MKYYFEVVGYQGRDYPVGMILDMGLYSILDEDLPDTAERVADAINLGKENVRSITKAEYDEKYKVGPITKEEYDKRYGGDNDGSDR